MTKVNLPYLLFSSMPNAENIFNQLLIALKSIPLENMVQLSMDGPNTNWKVFDLLNHHHREEKWSTLLNLGNCGLHVVHGGFQTGVKATDWEIEKVLRAIWQTFHDSPARWEMYTRIGGTDVFPLR